MDDDENREVVEEDEDEEPEGRRMLSVLFGNVDDAGDLDEEYLDQDAKEHLSALAAQLGQSLADIELSARRKRSGSLPDEFQEQEEDFGRKADDAVDYEDIEEQYEGPEVQMPSQDDQAILQNEQFYAQAALAGPALNLGAFNPEEENYDEEDDYDEAEETSQKIQEDFTISAPEEPVTLPRASEGPDVYMTGEDLLLVESRTESEVAEPVEELLCMPEKAPGLPSKLEFPVLCEEEGKEVLRFSELFGYHEPYWTMMNEKRRQKGYLQKGSLMDGQEMEVVEEDEELLLKSCPEKINARDEALVSEEFEESEENAVEEEDSEVESSIFALHQGRNKLQVNSRNYFCVSSQPMKEHIDDCDLILERRQRVPSPNFLPIHQEDWEDNILWDSEVLHSVLEDTTGNSHASFSDMSEEIEMDMRGDESCHLENQSMLQRVNCRNPASEKHQHLVTCQGFRPILIEPLCSISHTGKGQGERMRQHPQMLRLETLPFSSKHNMESGIDKHNSNDGRADKVFLSFQKLSLQNSELLSGSWMEQIIWDDEAPDGTVFRSSRVIFDLQDNQMVFEIPETKEGQYLRAHTGSMVVNPPMKSAVVEAGDVHSHGAVPLTRFNISNDKFYMNKKTSQQHKSNIKKRAVHGIKVMHSLPAIKLQTMKPKLTNKDLAYFHRPKAIWYPHHNEVAAKEQGKLFVEGPMKIILKTLGGKGSKLYVDASETLEAVKAKAAKKFGDLKASERTKFLYSGKELEEGGTLAQQEVPPNSLLHLVRTKVHPWAKAQRLPGENKPIRPPGAFRKKSELSVKDGHVALMEYCEERPLLLGNVGMGARLSTYYRKLTSTDSTAASLRNERGSWVGVPLPLEPTEDSPFLGDIRQGDTQSCLETNMYRSPVFPHKVASTDFLLVRSAKGKLSLRRIDSIHVVGQQEPHVEVFTPSSKTVQNFVGDRLLVYVYREFRDNEKPGFVPRVRADELAAQFPFLSEGYLRKRLKRCAELQKGPGGEMWWLMRRNFRIPSEEELRRMITPENVCTYESMQAGLYHLKRMGVNKLTHPGGLSAAMIQLPDEAIALAAASHIERELQITPWNLSCNFVAATMQGRGSLERLEITGAGDPSGRGLGFSYLRIAPKAPGSGSLVEKKAAAARGGGAVTGTDADLRRLSMDAAREVLLKFKIPETQIDKMTRWHRIALVRKLSSEQAASGVKVGIAALNKFARGQRMSFLQVQQQTREKCQEIWDRQVQSLSAVDGNNSESEGEANEDLDSFAGDLENLLEAEEGDEEVASRKGRKETMRGTNARRRALEAQREEEIEDEEAEAAELRRMLMEDDEADEDKKKKKIVTMRDKKDKEDATKEQKKDTTETVKANGMKKKRKVIKRIIRTKKPDGSHTLKEILITDPKEIAQYLAKKNASQNGNIEKDRKKSTVAGKKEKKSAAGKNIKKQSPAKKTTKAKSGKDGLQVICGACKQLGHMRTNKKLCPLYMEESEATALQKQEKIVTEEVGEKHGIKLTLKRPSGASQKKIHQPGVQKNAKNQKPAKLPSLKIKLAVLAHAEVVSSSILNENTATPTIADAASPDDARNVGVESSKKVSRKLEASSMNIAKKLKPQKKKSVKKESYSKKKDPRLKVSGVIKKGRSIQPGSLKDFDVEYMSREEMLEKKQLYKMEIELEKERDWQRQREEDENLQRRLEEERLQREKEEEELRQQREKQRIKEEKERRRAKKREAKLRREEEEKERIRQVERKKELERQAEQERQMEIKRQREIQRQRELEMQREQERERERQRKLELLKEQEEKENERIREQQRREKEKRKSEEKRKPRRTSEREKWFLEKDRGKGTKRRTSVELRGSSRISDFVPQSKRRKGGEVMLSNILETIVDILKKKTEVSYLFLKPVTKKEAPDYLDVIRYPMDLSTIREKVRKMLYKGREEFRRDVWQIAENAHIYNDHRNPGIPPLADRLLEICDDLLEEREEELADAESAVERLDEDVFCTTATTSPVLDRRRITRHH